VTRRLQALLLIASTGAISPAASADCRDETLCVDEISAGGNVELHARNLRNFPITYTLRVRAGNFSLTGPNTVTAVLEAGGTQQVMVVSARQGGDQGIRYDYRWTVGDKDARHDEQYVYSLPYARDRAYRVLQGYGSRFSHTGREQYAVDFDMPEGTAVHAARAGLVARVEESHDRGCWNDGCGRFANFIVILHDDGTTGEYYHLARNGALVGVGEHVSRGQKIGLSGNTGHTTMPHLHFAVYRAIAWGRTQSIAVRFQSADGIIDRPRRGARYQAQ